MSFQKDTEYNDILKMLHEHDLQTQKTLSQNGIISSRRPQPVHVLYGGAQRFTNQTLKKLERLCLSSFESFAVDPLKLKSILGESWSPEFAEQVFESVKSKLKKNPIEDFRIDFEDGYGEHSDNEEDSHAVSAAGATHEILMSREYSGKFGIRIKSLAAENRLRSLKTLFCYFQNLFKASDIQSFSIDEFVVTLPKVTHEIEISALVSALEMLELNLKLPKNFFRIEILIESPQALLSIDGQNNLPKLVAASKGRCLGLHLGVYDLNSSLGLGSAGQDISNFTCDFYRTWMLTTAALFPGVTVVDGVINELPVPLKLNEKSSSSDRQRFDIDNEIHLIKLWRLNYRKMLRSLSSGFFQSWDLHPTQVVLRHIANHAFLHGEIPGAILRLKNFEKNSSAAALSGATFDDLASYRGVFSLMSRALNSQVITIPELLKEGLDFEACEQKFATLTKGKM
ncbi:MAG: hypothetical protein NT027_13250 [Proteobacteria bacterium]|nr:hypothetical protein [Pseudomonadota bacterium]